MAETYKINQETCPGLLLGKHMIAHKPAAPSKILFLLLAQVLLLSGSAPNEPLLENIKYLKNSLYINGRLRVPIGVIPERVDQGFDQPRQATLRGGQQKYFPTSNFTPNELKVFSGEFSKFINVTPDTLAEKLKDFPVITGNVNFGQMLARLLSMKEGLMRQYYEKYPYYCQHVDIVMELIEHGYTWRQITSLSQEFPALEYKNLPIKRHFYWFVVYGDSNDDAFIVDLAADQFEGLSGDTFADLGVVILPMKIVDENPNHFWMYTGAQPAATSVNAQGRSATLPLELNRSL